MLLAPLIDIKVLLDILYVLLASAVKFVFSPSLAVELLHFNYLETICITTAGGISGLVFFFYLSSAVIKIYDIILKKIRETFLSKERLKKRHHKKKKKKKVHTWRNKFLVKLRGKYGMVGIVVLTPVLLSIPLGAFLANKYYKNKGILWYLSISVAVWSCILSTIYFL
jgi:hypothetical protein